MLEPIVIPMIIVHVVTAIASLVLGAIAMRINTNKKRHGQIGRAYGLVMGISMLLGVLILTVRFNFFLTMITLLSTQSLITGYRAAKRKYRNPVNLLDWSVTVITALFSVGYIGWNVLVLTGTLSQTMPTTFLYVGIGFSLFLGQGAYEEYTFYRKHSTDRRAWLIFHFNRMLGSYVALVTAFVITMARYTLPEQYYWMSWVLPPVLGGVLIARYTKRYKARFAPKKVAVAGD